MSEPHIFLFAPSWSHLDQCSGFNPLIRHLKTLDKRYKIINMKLPAFMGPFERLFFHLNSLLGITTHRFSLWSQVRIFQCIIAQRFSRKSLFIFLASENQLTSLAMRMIPFRYISVIHQPPSWFLSKPVMLKLINSSLQIVCLSDYQRRLLSPYVTRPISVLRHGVSSASFVPHAMPNNDEEYHSRPTSLLIIGKHLRDDDLTIQVLNLLLECNQDISVKIFSPTQKFLTLYTSRIKSTPRISILKDLSPRDYVYKLQTGFATLLLLNDTTVNNALLESLSMGIPVVTTNVGAMGEYASLPGLYILASKSPRDYVDILISLYEKTSFVNAHDLFLRRKSLHDDICLKYSWDNVAVSYHELFKSVA